VNADAPSSHWAALGAFTTIILLAFDSFFQASISYNGSLTHRRAYENIVTLGRSTGLHTGTVVTEFINVRWPIQGSNDTVPVFLHNTHPDFGLASAVYNSFSNFSMLPERTVQFNCPTGNCTWSTFSSLSICSSCNDVSSYISRSTGCAGVGCPGQNCTTRACSSIQDGSDVTLQSYMQANAHNFTNYMLPYSHIKSFDGRKNDAMTLLTTPVKLFPRQPRTLMTVNTTANAYETISFQDLETLLASFLIMRASAGFLNNTTPWEKSTPTATECALSLCIKAYRATAKSGTLKETVVGTSNQVEPRSWLMTTDLGALDPATKVRGSDIDRSLAQGAKSTNRSTPFRTDLQLVMNKNESLDIDAARYNISQAAILSTINFLLSLSASPYRLLVYPQNLNDTMPDVPRISEALWNLENMTATFENVANSVTNYIRDTSPVKEQGTMQEWVVHIRIKWLYMTLPIIAMLTGCLYIFLTILETTQLGLPVWKEGALPTLAYGFDEHSQKALRAMDATGQSKVAAKTTIVNLCGAGDDMKLRTIGRISASNQAKGG
jgi:hypothetical protein